MFLKRTFISFVLIAITRTFSSFVCERDFFELQVKIHLRNAFRIGKQQLTIVCRLNANNRLEKKHLQIKF